MATKSGPIAVVVVAAGVAALLGVAGGIQRARDRAFPPEAAREDSLAITSGPTMVRLTKGYNALAADVYWIRTIQYFGSTKLRLVDRTGTAPLPGAYDALYPMLDLTTTLDPRFNIAYRFGAIFLAEAYPGGAGRPDLATALLEKGLRARPDKWEYMQDIGFVNYWWRHDYKAAAAWFTKAGDVPGAPWWLKSLAATTLAEGGDRKSSRLMWETLRETAEIDWLKRDAERRLLQLQALDDMDALQGVVDRYVQATGRTADWPSLIAARMLRGVPGDPAGTAYEINAQGRVRLSMKSPLFPLPEEPQRLMDPPLL